MNKGTGADTSECPDWHRWSGIDQLSSEDSARIFSVPLPVGRIDRKIPEIVWLGHSSFLIQWQKTRILIDPVFSRFVGVMARRCPVLHGWQSLNPDYILLSHAHMDHLDKRTLSAYLQAKILLPENSERFLSKRSRSNCVLLKEGQTENLGTLQIQAVPARHGGWRYPWQRNCRALGYLLTDGDHCVYYAGDTAYGSHFQSIGRQEKIDTALLPIGAYAPQWFLQSRHLNPEEAVKAFADTGAERMIPFHFGAYRLSLEPLNEPLPRFAKKANSAGIDWFLPVGF